MGGLAAVSADAAFAPFASVAASMAASGANEWGSASVPSLSRSPSYYAASPRTPAAEGDDEGEEGEADEDDDGTLSWDEFLASVPLHVRNQTPESEIREWFGMLDADGSDTVSR